MAVAGDQRVPRNSWFVSQQVDAAAVWGMPFLSSLTGKQKKKKEKKKYLLNRGAPQITSDHF